MGQQTGKTRHWLTFKGKYVSEALILESLNPQYDKRLFIEFLEKYKFRTCCVQIFCFDITSMNNILSYCGLTNARMRASEKDLPVVISNNISNLENFVKTQGTAVGYLAWVLWVL